MTKRKGKKREGNENKSEGSEGKGREARKCVCGWLGTNVRGAINVKGG